MTENKPLFERGRLTDWLLSTLLRPTLETLTPPILVGDGRAPEAGGWSGAQPGQGDFVPYTALFTGPAAPDGKQAISLGEAQDWLCRYQLRHAGGLRSQADWIADRSRQAWDRQGEIRLDLGGPPQWKAYRFTVASMGAVTRNDTVDPPYWEVTDEVVLALSRCRT